MQQPMTTNNTINDAIRDATRTAVVLAARDRRPLLDFDEYQAATDAAEAVVA